MGRDGGLGSAQIWTTGGPHSLGNQSIKASTGGWWAWAEAHPCLPQGTRHAWRLPLFASSSPPASDSHCSTPAHSHAHTLLCARGSCRTCSHSHAPSPSQLSTLLPDPASSPPTPSACLRPPFTHQANSMSIYYANFCASPHIPDSSRWGLGAQGRGTQRPAGVGPRQPGAAWPRSFPRQTQPDLWWGAALNTPRHSSYQSQASRHLPSSSA